MVEERAPARHRARDVPACLRQTLHRSRGRDETLRAERRAHAQLGERRDAIAGVEGRRRETFARIQKRSETFDARIEHVGRTRERAARRGHARVTSNRRLEFFDVRRAGPRRARGGERRERRVQRARRRRRR